MDATLLLRNGKELMVKLADTRAFPPGIVLRTEQEALVYGKPREGTGNLAGNYVECPRQDLPPDDTVIGEVLTITGVIEAPPA